MKNIAMMVLLLFLSTGCSSKSGMDLINAVKANDIEKVKKIADSKNVNETYETEATPLMWASFNGNVEIMEHLVSKGADCKKSGVISVKGKDKQVETNITFYRSSLNAAAGEGRLKAVIFLIEKCGLSANEEGEMVREFRYLYEDLTDPAGLCKFISNSDDPVSKYIRGVRPLSETGCNNGEILSKKDAYFESAIIAIFGEIMKSFVISEKVGINRIFRAKSIKDISNNRRIFDKIFGNYLNKLNDYSYFDNTKSGASPLIEASSSGKKDVVKYLLSKGANPNFQYGFGLTALDEAIYNYNYDVAEILLENGAKADLFMELSSGFRVYPAFGIVPLYSCFPSEMGMDKYNQKMKSLIPLMIKAGAKTENFFFPITKACRCKNQELVEFLISVGVDPNLEVDGRKIREFCKDYGIEIKDE
ncbi:MAG TPA: ankyrin repeat domain-containing protein [bacterium]|nr:ankyrin repeat domain-containing protein [bacterium]